VIAKSLIKIFRDQENSLHQHEAQNIPLARVELAADSYLTIEFRKKIIGTEQQQTYASLYFIFADYSGLRWRSFDEPVPLHPDYVRRVIYGKR
jgi:hypothetical protein